MELTDLIINFSIQDEMDDVEVSVQHGSESPVIKIPTNESLMKCISGTESLIAQQVIKYAKYELKTVIDEIWRKIGANDVQSQETLSQLSEETSMKNRLIVFYYSLLKFVSLRDNT